MSRQDERTSGRADAPLKDEDAVPRHTLDEMIAYYRARASEYDQWFLRSGRYDRGPAANGAWFAEARQVFAALDELKMEGDLLELAPGTGIWTERLAHGARTLTVVDSSPEMVALNRARLGTLASRVSYVLADLFSWQPEDRYDGIAFAFWLSHVPRERLDPFLEAVAAALHPRGKVFFVDSRRDPSSTARNHLLPLEGEQVATRLLNDGRSFRIVKNFHDPSELAARCVAAGLQVRVQETATYFVYGVGERRG